MAAPLVSVVIPTRNRAAYIQQALQSVFAQTIGDYEIIVVDDGSTDETARVLQPLHRQERIRYFAQEPRGVSAARNFGVSRSAGTYIAFLDSDDLFLPSKLEKQLEVFKAQPQLGFVHCWFSKFSDDGRDLGIRNTSRFRGRIYPDLLLEWSVLMAMPCMLMRKAAFEVAGGFDVHMTWAEDLDLWRRMARQFEVNLVPEALVKVRVHADSTSFDKSKAGEGFVRYLDKALHEDRSLSEGFRREARARMYTKLAQNLLGEGGPAQMRIARQHATLAVQQQPLRLAGWLTWLASLLPLSVRKRLVGGLRRSRYRPAKSESI